MILYTQRENETVAMHPSMPYTFWVRAFHFTWESEKRVCKQKAVWFSCVCKICEMPLKRVVNFFTHYIRDAKEAFAIGIPWCNACFFVAAVFFSFIYIQKMHFRRTLNEHFVFLMKFQSSPGSDAICCMHFKRCKFQFQRILWHLSLLMPCQPCKIQTFIF